MVQVLALLLDRGVDIEALGFSLLVESSNVCHAGCTELLLSRGADPNPSGSPPPNFIPLLQAAGSGHVPVVGQLLAAGADPRVTDRTGLTAVHTAAKYGHRPGRMACIDLLLARGADVNAVDNEGRTALHLTRVHCVALFLLERGAHLEAVDSEGVIAFDPDRINTKIGESNAYLQRHVLCCGCYNVWGKKIYKDFSW